MIAEAPTEKAVRAAVAQHQMLNERAEEVAYLVATVRWGTDPRKKYISMYLDGIEDDTVAMRYYTDEQDSMSFPLEYLWMGHDEIVRATSEAIAVEAEARRAKEREQQRRDEAAREAADRATYTRLKARFEHGG
jgi:hypothetical protein